MKTFGWGNLTTPIRTYKYLPDRRRALGDYDEFTEIEHELDTNPAAEKALWNDSIM